MKMTGDFGSQSGRGRLARQQALQNRKFSEAIFAGDDGLLLQGLSRMQTGQNIRFAAVAAGNAAVLFEVVEKRRGYGHVPAP